MKIRRLNAYSSCCGFLKRIAARTLTLEQPPSGAAHSTEQQYHVLKQVRLREAGVPGRPAGWRMSGSGGLFCARCLFGALYSSSPAANAAAAAVAAATTDTVVGPRTYNYRKSHRRKPLIGRRQTAITSTEHLLLLVVYIPDDKRNSMRLPAPYQSHFCQVLVDTVVSIEVSVHSMPVKAVPVAARFLPTDDCGYYCGYYSLLLFILLKIAVETNKWTSTPHSRNVCLRHYGFIGLFMTLTFDLWPWNIFSNVHSHDECLWQVSTLQ